MGSKKPANNKLLAGFYGIKSYKSKAVDYTLLSKNVSISSHGKGL
ncbi:MAG: hypothetical protein ACI89T_000393 [Cognaticolwellia sp.]|jgi:hypothetical protein